MIKTMLYLNSKNCSHLVDYFDQITTLILNKYLSYHQCFFLLRVYFLTHRLIFLITLLIPMTQILQKNFCQIGIRDGMWVNGEEVKFPQALVEQGYELADRGEKLMAERLWQRAVGELSMVPGDDVPAPAMQTAHKNLGICMLRMGESKAAVGYLQSAVALSEGADMEAKQLLLTAQRNPEEAIDRVVDSSSLRDSERPMWEAFETASASSGPTRVPSR